MDRIIAFSLVAFAVCALGFIAYRWLALPKGVSLEKPVARPPASVDEGTVARIAIVTDDYGATAHILMAERPTDPVSIRIDAEQPAIPLTQVGDRIRIEHEGDDDEAYVFRNLTTGLSVDEG